MNEKQRMLSGQLYFSGDSQLKKEKNSVQKLLKKYNKLLPSQTKTRYSLIQKIFSKAGKSCSVYPPFYCDYGYNIYVGDYFFANINCVILDVAKVSIGNHVMLGPNAMILTACHPINLAQRVAGYGFGRPVIIEDNVWIGAGVIINPGVHIGCNTVIGSGSVVTHDIPSNVVAAGNPCTIIRKTSDSN